MPLYQVQFYLGLLLALPLLPLLAYLGIKTKRSVVVLPEAKIPQGVVESPEGKAFRLLILGESTMAGVGVAYHEEGFPGSIAHLLQQQLKRPIHWQVLAQNGLTAKGVRNTLLPKIPDESFDLILIGLGGNDTFEINTPSQWASENKRLIQALQHQQPKVPIVYIHLPPVGQFPAFPKLLQLFLGGLVQLHGKALQQVVQPIPRVWFCAESLAFAKWEALQDSSYTIEDFFSDGVHPSALTYRLWAEEVAQFIKAHPSILRTSTAASDL